MGADAPEDEFDGRSEAVRRNAGSSASDNSDDFLFGGGAGRDISYDSNRSQGVQISYIAGTISNTETRSFEKLIYRTSRGKVLTRFHDKDFTLREFDGTIKTKTVYVLIYQEGALMRDKITRVCNTFQGKIFTLPEDGQAGPQPFMKMI